MSAGRVASHESRVTDAYEMVVGLEVHVQLKTATKAFCSCSTSFGDAPNSNTCPVCLALPGSLPVLNSLAVDLAVRSALALGCTVHQTSVFARKNYFYPDLPKGYQISQFDKPLATGGHVAITREDGSSATIGVTRLHMEEDAGKSLHDRYHGATAIDLNRAGVPLIEIVSEPDMRSTQEAGAYLRAVKQILEYMDVSDVSMEEGSLRVDANVSARRKGESTLGQKTEVKNMNSFSGVEQALAVEFTRQCEVLARGGTIAQQTMLWDASASEVRPARAKEGSHDYRYFPEPDLPPLVLEPAWIEKIRGSISELPSATKARFEREYKLNAQDVAELTATSGVAAYYDEVVKAGADPKAAANWVIGEAKPRNLPITPSRLAELLAMLSKDMLSHTAAKQVFEASIGSSAAMSAIAKERGLLKVSDDSALARWLDEVVAEMPKEAERYKAGEKKLQGVLIGAVMKKSKGSADPKKLAQLLAERFGT